LETDQVYRTIVVGIAIALALTAGIFGAAISDVAPVEPLAKRKTSKE
jgi:hypothetical protein